MIAVVSISDRLSRLSALGLIFHRLLFAAERQSLGLLIERHELLHRCCEVNGVGVATEMHGGVVRVNLLILKVAMCCWHGYRCRLILHNDTLGEHDA